MRLWRRKDIRSLGDRLKLDGGSHELSGIATGITVSRDSSRRTSQNRFSRKRGHCIPEVVDYITRLPVDNLVYERLAIQRPQALLDGVDGVQVSLTGSIPGNRSSLEGRSNISCQV